MVKKKCNTVGTCQQTSLRALKTLLNVTSCDRSKLFFPMLTSSIQTAPAGVVAFIFNFGVGRRASVNSKLAAGHVHRGRHLILQYLWTTHDTRTQSLSSPASILFIAYHSCVDRATRDGHYFCVCRMNIVSVLVRLRGSVIKKFNFRTQPPFCFRPSSQ